MRVSAGWELEGLRWSEAFENTGCQMLGETHSSDVRFVILS